MDIAEVEESLFAATDAKLHGGMCRVLSAIYCKVLGIFPVLEEARPRSKSGIQALCSLHVALEKTKNILQHCSECSKLYLAITGDSVLSKFEKARSALVDCLRRVQDTVPQAIGSQIAEIVIELEGAFFSIDPAEKQIGEEIIALLQQGRKFDRDSGDINELECFHQAALKLGLNSSRAALTERRALKRIIERARMEEDKRKESIVAYLLHLMRKYSKLFRSEVSDDNDSQGSAPCSPTVLGSLEDCGGPGANGHAFERQLSRLSSFNFKPNIKRSGQVPVPPEELRCPISLQLMYDPVIISSGQTYERICIEKWFSDGHNTCPKTQQKLAHLGLTPNYCVKGLVATWCEHNGVPVPDGPPESLDLNYWRLALSELDSANSKSVDGIKSCKLKEVKVVPVEESGCIEEVEEHNIENHSEQGEDNEPNMFKRYENFLTVLNEDDDIRRKLKVVEQIRVLLKDDEEARIFMGANGFVEALVWFLESAIHGGNEKAQEVGAMALFNLAVSNNRNKEKMLAARVIPLLEEMISNSRIRGAASALYLNLSCLEDAKPVMGSSGAVSFLIQNLSAETEPQCKLDSVHALYNLSTHPGNIPNLLSAGIIDGLHSLLTACGSHSLVEKAMAVLINIANSNYGKEKIISSAGIIGALATILDTGEPSEQEQAVAGLLILCSRNERCSELVLQEGVIPSLVCISVNGTRRGKEKAQKLLMLFRQQRQRDPPRAQIQQRPETTEKLICDEPIPAPEPKPLSKSVSRRKKMGRAISSLWKSKNSFAYHG
ncbi:U-box domain [Dillenia turbinata]|uniref:RING-type E3 ubiquitin transferase n=1 Tax=Dillenia turbinata TaxID=194707 RepID=A0AAN8V2E8_9MAGN